MGTCFYAIRWTIGLQKVKNDRTRLFFFRKSKELLSIFLNEMNDTKTSELTVINIQHATIKKKASKVTISLQYANWIKTYYRVSHSDMVFFKWL